MKNKIKRFFEPSMQMKGDFIRMYVKHTLMALFLIMIILFVKSFVGALQKDDIETVKQIFFYFIGANILYFTTMICIKRWGWAGFYYEHIKKIEQDIYTQFNQLDNTYVEKIGTGKIISIFSKGVDKWTEFVIIMSEVVPKIVVFLIFSVLFLWDLGWKFVVFFLGLIFVSHVVVYYLNKYAMITREGRRVASMEHNRQLVKMIMSKFEIMQNKKNQHEIDILHNWTDSADKVNKVLFNYLFPMYLLPDGVFFLIITGVLGMLLYTGVEFASILGIFLVLSLFIKTLATSVDFFKEMTKSFYEVEHIWEFFDNAPKMDLQKEKPDFEYKTGKIEIQNISFGYDEKNPVFSNFSLSLEGAKKIAFVGASGGGKTTLIKMISGFIKQNAGDILIDEQNLKEVSLESFYKNIGYLTQEPSVFDGSVEDNLLYGTFGEVSENQIIQAIKNAGCEFVYELPDGLQTQIGERGVRLSGGQKQRLAIAKLFLKNPKIIILDEPTSALDSFSEEKITQSLHTLFTGRTVLIIAHRLQTVKDADEIIVLEGGIVIERGNHETLVANNGYYKKMLDLQSGF